jgi:hypothetical protein
MKFSVVINLWKNLDLFLCNITSVYTVIKAISKMLKLKIPMAVKKKDKILVVGLNTKFI